MTKESAEVALFRQSKVKVTPDTVRRMTAASHNLTGQAKGTRNLKLFREWGLNSYIYVLPSTLLPYNHTVQRQVLRERDTVRK